MSKNNKYIPVIIILLISMVIGCSEDWPASTPYTLKIMVIDSSSVFTKLYNGKIPGVKVKVKSTETSREFIGFTDTSGIALINLGYSDYYNIILERSVTEDEMFRATGNRTEGYLNGQMMNVYLDKSIVNSAAIKIPINIAQIGTIIFSEIYYNGAKAPPSSYYSDQFTELYNNTDSVRYVDGLVITNVMKDFITDQQFIHASMVWQFPGGGKDYPILPGGFIIVAQDGIDHREFNSNSIDLSKADFEYYNERPDGKDLDNPAVPNMIRIQMDTKFDVLYSVMSDGMILVKIPDIKALEKDEKGYLKIPSKYVIDGVEWIADRDLSKKKLLPSIDISCTGGMPTYSGKSVERKILRRVTGRAILSDQNNSAVDFDTLAAPTLRSLH
jgi:hypothetical protein